MTRCRCNNCPECLPPGRVMVDELEQWELCIEHGIAFVGQCPWCEKIYFRQLREQGNQTYEDAMDTLESTMAKVLTIQFEDFKSIVSGLKQAWDEETERLDNES